MQEIRQKMRRLVIRIKQVINIKQSDFNFKNHDFFPNPGISFKSKQNYTRSVN